MSAQATSSISPRRIGRKIAIAFAALFALLLFLLGVLSFLLSTQNGSQWVLVQAEQRLISAGISVDIEGVEGTIFRGLSFQNVYYRDATKRLELEDLHTSWNPYSVLTGRLLLSELRVARIKLEIQSEEDSAAALDIATVANPLPISVSIPNLEVDELEFIQADQTYSLDSLVLGMQLGDAGVALNSIELQADRLNLGGQLELGFVGERDVAARFDWRYALASSQDSEQYGGQLELGGNLAALEVSHRLETPQEIESSGMLLTGLFDGDLRFELNHSAELLVLPFEVRAGYAISELSLDSSGDLDRLSLALRSKLRYEGYDNIELESQAIFAGTTLDIQDYRLTRGDNSLRGTARIDWSDVLRAVGGYELNLQAIDTLVQLPDAIDLSSLSGSGGFDLALPDTGVQGRLDIEQIEGRISNFPLQVEGAVLFESGRIEIDDLLMTTENNSLALNGSYSDTLDLNWSVSASSLQEFVADSRGALEGSGSLEGDLSAPDIRGVVTGSDVAYQQVSLGQFDFDFQRIDELLDSELSITELNYSDGAVSETLSPVVLILSGSENSHRIDLSAKSRYGDFLVSLTGELTDLRNLSWQGSLETATVDTAIGTWSTRAATSIAASAAQIDIGESCWIQQESTLCIELDLLSVELISIAGSLQNYPLGIFNAGESLAAGAGSNLVRDQLLLPPNFPEGSTLSGSVDGRFSIDIPASADLSLDFSLQARDALLSIAPQLDSGDVDSELADSAQEYALEVLKLSGSSEAGVWRLSADAGFVRGNIDDSEIGVRGEISADIGIAANNELSGTVDAGLEDLRWLQALLPDLSNIGGAINARANLVGSVEAPEATGSINLENASVDIEALGLSLRAISANLSSDGTDSVSIVGQAQSGAGQIRFDGEIVEPFSASPSITARVNGENFQLAHVPNLELLVSPDVAVNFGADEIEVNGSLHMPTFNLTLQELPESAVDVSRDVVIVSYPSDRPDLARSMAANESTMFDRPLTGDIDITLGDDVSFAGFGLSTRLEGNLNIQQAADGSNRTYGELSIVEGNYELYRQSLDISQGKLLFFGAYDNPGIDLRATREVDDYTVGVLMNGTLKNIQSQLFSTPALPENDIIAVLVTGRPFSEVGEQDGNAILTAIANLGIERGEGLTNQVRNKLGLDVLAVDASDDIDNSVLTIGKYLTPKIFVRYGIGLFDSQSKVAVDYTLSERIKFQAESGEYQSVDVIFSVER